MKSGVVVTNGIARYDILDLTSRVNEAGSFVGYNDGSQQGDLGECLWFILGLPEVKKGPYSIFELAKNLANMQEMTRKNMGNKNFYATTGAITTVVQD